MMTLNQLLNGVARLARDERGAQVLEYALIAGMTTVVALTGVAAVGAKVKDYWRALDAALGS